MNGVNLGRDLGIEIGMYGLEYSEENILRGVKEMYPEFSTL